MIERFRKEPLILEESDSVTVLELKRECNTLVDCYNCLANPLSDQGQQLTLRISFLLHKILALKEASSAFR